MRTPHGGGTSRKRMHAAKDYSGAEIMRTLRDEVLNRGIPVVDFTSAIEIILDENGRAAGAVLMNMETNELMVARAKTVIIATGGAGRMHYQGFPTSNHYGATADGLVLGYRVGAKLLYVWASSPYQSCLVLTRFSPSHPAPQVLSRYSERLLPKKYVLSEQSL